MLFGLLYPDSLCRGMDPDPIPDANPEPVTSLVDPGGIENWPQFFSLAIQN
jgi:hypothetical protein